MLPKLDVDRAITTIQMVMSGGKPASVDDISQALAFMGTATDALLLRLVEIDRADVAWSYINQLVQQLPPPRRSST